MRGEGIENLSRVGEVGLEGVDIRGWVWKGDQVQVQDFVALGKKIWDDMPTSLSASLVRS